MLVLIYNSLFLIHRVPISGRFVCHIRTELFLLLLQLYYDKSMVMLFVFVMFYFVMVISTIFYSPGTIMTPMKLKYGKSDEEVREVSLYNLWIDYRILSFPYTGEPTCSHSQWVNLFTTEFFYTGRGAIRFPLLMGYLKFTNLQKMLFFFLGGGILKAHLR